MKLPPKWKVRREIRRIREKFGRVTSYVADPYRTKAYDRAFAGKVKTFPGDLAWSTRVAVVVLYQPGGVARSVFFTLRHLIANGYTPMIVSNALLPASDLAELKTLSALVVVRPNVGYDFGAYRDGIRILRETGTRLERLVIMNDSTWFPLSEADTTLNRLEMLDTGLRGHIFKFEPKTGKGRDHVESHLLMFTGEAVADPSFVRFWEKYPISNLRNLTIDRGEKGITAVFEDNGLGRDGLLTPEKLRDLLDRLDPPQTLEVLNRLVIHQPAVQEERTAIAAAFDGTESWRKATLEWMIGLLNSFQYLISATFVEPAVSLGGMGFAKKSNELRYHLARKQLLDADRDRRIPPLQADVRAEIEAAVANWQPDEPS